MHAHHRASQHYIKRLGRWLRLTCLQREAGLPGKFRVRAGPMPAAFQSRILAFARAGEAISAEKLLERFLCGDTAPSALSSIEHAGVVLRRGSVVLPDAESDGFVILKIDNRNRMVQTALVSRTQDCARHPRCMRSNGGKR